MYKVQMVLCVSMLSATAFAQFDRTIYVNCAHGESLQRAITFALPGTTIVARGNCMGPVSIITPGLTIDGHSSGRLSSHRYSTHQPWLRPGLFRAQWKGGRNPGRVQ